MNNFQEIKTSGKSAILTVIHRMKCVKKDLK